jgi:hypothetical protein
MTPEQQKVWDLLKKTNEEIAAEIAEERFQATIRKNLRVLRDSLRDSIGKELLDRASKDDT